MRIIRVRYRDRSFYAAITSPESVRCLNNEEGLPDEIPLSEVELLPLVRPSKVVCVGLNYRDHARELGLALPDEPILFLKPSSSVIGPGDAIVMPACSERVDYEAELALVIGKTARFVSEAEARSCVFGYTCANDVTARDLQTKDGQWTRAKSFDTFCPVGPWIETHVTDERALGIRAVVNGQVRQQGTTADMIFPPAMLVSFISRVMTLLPGDVILTGSPAGIGPLAEGDEVSVEIDQVGFLLNPVISEGPSDASAVQ
ncbi:MAG: fumarylacetoacetate hydrolase family protein [Humidesulfovibrio sp.]|uniref:fumarylacetoacetate hydrolase family protein n=1 Tax=Humidesulfovibrio sp. TaxID=2910988 RepID=UPI00273418FD|nr:fumarylacetoacetate hydrolase family protein [Humidesulfovibrio sp.]MDP2848978.1 fumarylacetoacetate hydrolase family protein [Humidesulfovibrio sp.]